MNAGKKKFRLQGKKPSHRRSVIQSQTIELLRSGKIKTTPAKAKILSSHIERLITLAKSGNSAEVSRFLPQARAQVRLTSILPSFSTRTSGYTRVLKTLPRKGDNAAQSYIMFTDEIGKAEKKSVIRKTIEKQKTTKPKKK
jgi:large subunit ribosomal protein L17